MPIKRRRFLQALSAGAGLATLGLPAVRAAKGTRIVVIGGGFGGATAAKYLRLWGPDLEVILIERNRDFISCPQSNLVLGGSRTLKDLTLGYETLTARHGVQLVHDEVNGIDPQRQTLALSEKEISYDRLVIAPGIDFVYDGIAGLEDPAVREAIPHAWKAGPQTIALRQQLEAMPNGGRFLMSIPRMPYRCPPGPYERACQVAFFLRYSKPKARITVLDANPGIVAKQDQFLEAWEEKYPGIIEYHPNQEVTAVDSATRTVTTAAGKFRADVINIIPPQRAAAIAHSAGVVNVDARWCDVDFLSYESTTRKNIHVIGDAIASTLPKSGHMANAEAKVCAAAIVAMATDQRLVGGPVFANTCYSHVNASEAIHISNVYRYDPVSRSMQSVHGNMVSEQATRLDAYYARAWAMNIWSDVLD